MKPCVYVEPPVISYLTARRSGVESVIVSCHDKLMEDMDEEE